jgi:hypothetical protein
LAIGALALGTGVVAWPAAERGPILAALPIGAPDIPASPSVDPAGRVVVLDDGVADRVVTVSVQGNSYSWAAGPLSGLVLRAIDPRTGRQVWAISVPVGIQRLGVDPATHRLVTIDTQLNRQLQLYDLRSGRLLLSRPYGGDSDLGALLGDARTGRYFLATGTPIGPLISNPSQALTRRVRLLDFRTGGTPAIATFHPLGAGGAVGPGPLGRPFTLAVDAGRLYVFEPGRLSVLDGTSERVLVRRRLPFTVIEAQVARSSRRLFAVAWPWPWPPVCFLWRPCAC